MTRPTSAQPGNNPPRGHATFTQVEILSSQDARNGCQRLLARQLRTGKHWISDPMMMQRAMEYAGMT